MATSLNLVPSHMEMLADLLEQGTREKAMPSIAPKDNYIDPLRLDCCF